MSETYTTEMVAVDKMRPHPQNYRKHPEDQLEQIMQSIKEHGFYKNVVVARDYTILAGHGAVLASRRLGMEKVPVRKIDCDPFSAQAMRIIVGDNEIARLGELDDRALTNMLKEMAESDGGLLGTGFNKSQLAALVQLTRPASEIADIDEAAEWVGMPEYVPGKDPLRLIVQFDNEEQRIDLLTKVGALGEGAPAGVLYKRDSSTSKTWSMWWPLRERHDNASLRFDEADPELPLTAEEDEVEA